MHEGQHRRMLVSGRSNPSYELLAAFLALKSFASNQLQKKLILLRIDNISAVTYINQKGGTHSTQLFNLALEIWKWCLQKK